MKIVYSGITEFNPATGKLELGQSFVRSVKSDKVGRGLNGMHHRWVKGMDKNGPQKWTGL